MNELQEFEPKFRRARVWSNNELKKIASKFRGDIINVSGWADEDKQGKRYREYFVNADSYIVSNLGGGPQEGKALKLECSLNIELNAPIAEDMYQKYDVVFTHTVLEHVFNIFTAVENLCKLSRDIIITIVPFIQPFHIRKDNYLDYWRFTPFCLDALFKKHGFCTMFIIGNNIKQTSVYYLQVCSKNPQKWKKAFPDEIDLEKCQNGNNFLGDYK